MSEAHWVLHWYDFICPFCYVAQHRTAIFARRGIEVVDLPFRAHPEIPLGGIRAPSRIGPMYDVLEREAVDAGLPLYWPPRLPNTLRALEVAEWVRHLQSPAFPQLAKRFFAAHFALREDLEDSAVIDQHTGESGVDLVALHAGLADGNTAAAVPGARAP
jgi:predicted DsbA family dithiol-disulfide isomerase